MTFPYFPPSVATKCHFRWSDKRVVDASITDRSQPYQRSELSIAVQFAKT